MRESFAVPKDHRQRNRPISHPENRFFRALELNLVEHIEFFQAFIREPASVGALSPSSRSLGKAMIKGLSLRSATTVVELGPGTGAFTGLIREKIGKATTFIALELDPINADSLKRRFADVIVYNDSAENMRDYLALHRKQKADYIISGLPWASLPLELQERVMKTVVSSLPSAGIFTTFAYFHAQWFSKARLFRRRLQRQFERVEISPIVWRNVPPAFVYRCSNPVSLCK